LEAGAVILTYGIFSQTIINFLIIAFAVFLLVKGVSRLKHAQEESYAMSVGMFANGIIIMVGTFRRVGGYHLVAKEVV
jgi:large-conductance mechanosensitive channel